MPHFAEKTVTFGLPTNTDVSENQAGSAALAGSQNPEDIRRKQGYDNNLRKAWDWLPSFGFKNPFKKSNPPSVPRPTAPYLPEIVAGDPNAGLTIGDKKAEQMMGLLSLPPDTLNHPFLKNSALSTLQKEAADWVESRLESGFLPASFNKQDLERIKALDQDQYTYTGSDLRVIVDVAGGAGGGKQLIELSTITVSIHREKPPARVCGYANPKGYGYGRRTIAGTIILTQFWIDALFRFLADPAGYITHDKGVSDLSFSKIDQLPPFNMTFHFADEYGHASFRRMIGMTLITDGTVYSIHDQLTEQTISFQALDFTPLQPIDAFGALRDASTPAMKTPKDVAIEELNMPKPSDRARPGELLIHSDLAAADVALDRAFRPVEPAMPKVQRVPPSAGSAKQSPSVKKIFNTVTTPFRFIRGK